METQLRQQFRLRLDYDLSGGLRWLVSRGAAASAIRRPAKEADLGTAIAANVAR